MHIQPSFYRSLVEKLSSRWFKGTKKNMLLKKKRTNKCCEIIQSHRDYSFKKILGSPRVSSGCCTVTQRKVCNTQQSSQVTPSGQNGPPKNPPRNRPDDQQVKGVWEVAATPLSITHSALDLLADEGDRSGSHSTAFPGPFLPAASARGLQHIHRFPLCTGETKKDQKKLRHSAREESYRSVRACAQLPPQQP